MNAKAQAAAVALQNELEKEPKVLTLYELVDSLQAINDALEDTDGVLTDEIEAQLDALSGSLNVKVDSICTLRQNHLRTAEALEAEEERLKKRRKSAERAAESLRSYLFGQMVRMGESRIKTAKFSCYVQDNPLSVVWTKDEDPPAEFARVTIEPDVSKAKAQLAAGRSLPEGFEERRGSHLRIR